MQYLICMLGLSAVVSMASAFLEPTSPVCYGADTKLYTWCQGYVQAGYSCARDYCAVDKCVGSCNVCAHKYENNVVDAKSGKCCDSIDTKGEVNPKPGTPTQDIETYGYLGSLPGAYNRRRRRLSEFGTCIPKSNLCAERMEGQLPIQQQYCNMPPNSA